MHKKKVAHLDLCDVNIMVNTKNEIADVKVIFFFLLSFFHFSKKKKKDNRFWKCEVIWERRSTLVNTT